MSSIPIELLELIREDEKILATYEITYIFLKEGLFSTKINNIPGLLIISNRNIYLYAQSKILDKSILRDIPLQKITIAKFVALKNIGFLNKILKSNKITKLTEEFKLPEEALKNGILKIATTWEYIIFHPVKSLQDIKDAQKTAKKL